MKELKSGTHKIKLYSSIKEMPVERYNALQGWLMQDTAIGSTMMDVEAHFRNLDMFLNAGKIQEAITERQNLHMNFFTALNNISFKSLSFACLIHTIDNQPVGYSESELTNALSKLKALKYSEVEDILFELKKNCIGN